MSNLYIGLMSGTSLDGIDIVLCTINESECKLLHAQEYPFNQELKELILKSISSTLRLKSLGELDHRLALLFSDAILEFLNTFNIDAKEVTAIGLHGQTLWHEPEGKFPFSMQLGDANIIVATTGIQTVTDFRRMDIANGGQGAPFTPAFHQFLFSKLLGNIAVLNIGGMANLTLLSPKLSGWDTGCGNVLLDYWIQKTQNIPYDKDGKFAQSAVLNQELLELLLKDEYFKKKAPKSTGREYFNAAWLGKKLTQFPLIKDAQVQRTLTELTAQSIANDVNAAQIDTLILCGGGAKNSFLMQRLQKLCSCKLKKSDDFGVSSDFLEAMAFAWFAYKRVQKEPINLQSVTGAKKNSLLGAIYG